MLPREPEVKFPEWLSGAAIGFASAILFANRGWITYSDIKSQPFGLIFIGLAWFFCLAIAYDAQVSDNRRRGFSRERLYRGMQSLIFIALLFVLFWGFVFSTFSMLVQGNSISDVMKFIVDLRKNHLGMVIYLVTIGLSLAYPSVGPPSIDEK